MSYIKPKKKWDYLIFNNFKFPTRLKEEDLLFLDERSFSVFLLNNEWLMRRLGLYEPINGIKD